MTPETHADLVRRLRAVLLTMSTTQEFVLISAVLVREAMAALTVPSSPERDGARMVAKQMQERLAAVQREVDLAWEMIQNGWDIEPRSYFEHEAPKNGFESPLAQAVHHMWKRELKDVPPSPSLPQAQDGARREEELLEAAKWAVMEWRLHGQLTDSCRVLEAAIAKASLVGEAPQPQNEKEENALARTGETDVNRNSSRTAPTD